MLWGAAGQPAPSTQAAVWVDINNDGWLDLFIGNEDAPPQFSEPGREDFEDISPPPVSIGCRSPRRYRRRLQRPDSPICKNLELLGDNHMPP
jgi:hypothetical protein